MEHIKTELGIVNATREGSERLDAFDNIKKSVGVSVHIISDKDVLDMLEDIRRSTQTNEQLKQSASKDYLKS